MLVSYKWLQTYFEKELPPPEKMVEIFTFGIFEVEGTENKDADTIFDIKVLPDRAHDCLSHRGIARVLGALLDMPLRAEPAVSLPEESQAMLTVDIAEPAGCRRYVGRIVRGITIGPSPIWLRERLEAIGQRSINNVVDATNFVMFDIGQPLHAFDLSKVSGGIIVRRAKEGEGITTLDGKNIFLPNGTLVIADEKDPLAIAGVKGGMKAQVTEGTADIILEAANFNPVLVRKTSRGLGIITDSSRRFENELTPELAREAIDHATALICEIAGGHDTILESSVDVYTSVPEKRTISVSILDVNRLLGTALAGERVEEIFSRLAFSFTREGNGTYMISVPPERLDLREPADIVEDIAHIYGYGNIPSTAPPAVPAKINKKVYYTAVLRNILLREGFSEIYGYTFSADGEVEIENPLQKDRKFLRANLTDGILDALAKNILNAPLLGEETILLFECGMVFHKAGEKMLLAIGVHHGKKVKSGIIKDMLARIGEEIGAASIPAVDGYDLVDHMREVVALDMDAFISALPEPAGTYTMPASISTQYAPFSPYPFIARDIAVWVPENTVPDEITEVIIAEGGDLLVRKPTLFDEFKKDGKISYAFRFVFQASDRTLTDQEVNTIMERIYEKLRARGFVVR